MKDLELELKTLQFKYDLLKKVQEETPEIMMEDKEEELQMWKRYAYKLKPREDRMMKMVQFYRELNEELEEKQRTRSNRARIVKRFFMNLLYQK